LNNSTTLLSDLGQIKNEFTSKINAFILQVDKKMDGTDVQNSVIKPRS
jgi:hypothetical protein